MNWLTILGSIASVVGLIVSLYTLYRVISLPAALKRHSRDRQLNELIDRITRMSTTKVKITEATVREVEFILSTIRTYYVSRLPFKQKALKALLELLERELTGERRRVIVQNQLKLIRDEITIR